MQTANTLVKDAKFGIDGRKKQLIQQQANALKDAKLRGTPLCHVDTPRSVIITTYKSQKYVCRTTHQLTGTLLNYNCNHNPNPNPATKQHANVNIQLNMKRIKSLLLLS